MNPQDLFLAGGKPANIFFCEHCRNVARTKDEAEQCCRPYKCKGCGAECERYHDRCSACWSKERDAQELARFEKAQKIAHDAYGGWVYSETFDEYFPDVETFLDHLESGDYEGDRPSYVWATTENQFVGIRLDDVCNLDDAYEDFDSKLLVGLPELEAAIEAFGEANKHHVSYSPDYSRAIILPSVCVEAVA